MSKYSPIFRDGLITLVICCAVGCSDAGSAPGGATGAGQFKTPEACFLALQTAEKEKDVATSLACKSEASRNLALGGLAVYLENLAYHTNHPIESNVATACQAVLKKHGLERRGMREFLHKVAGLESGGETLGMMQIGASIRDPLTFMAEIAAATSKLKDFMPPNMSIPTPEMAEKLKELKLTSKKLTNVEIDGDQATASVVAKDQTAETVYFIRENGSWVIAASDDEPDWKKPIQGRFLFSDNSAEK